MDGHPQQQHPHPHHLPTNGKAATAVLKYVLSFVAGGLLTAFLLGGRTQQLADLLVWKGQMQAQVDTMNHEGTWASRQKLEEEAKDMGRFEVRIKKNEEAVEKIGTIIFKLEGLEKSNAEIKARLDAQKIK